MPDASHPLAAGVYHRSLTEQSWPPPPVPQPEDLEAANSVIRGFQQPTPLLLSQSLSERFGRHIYLKLELASPIRSFKHRGALVALQRISQDPSAHTVVTASTGNHGQGVAYAAGLLGLKTIVYAPEGAVGEKLAAMRNLGADIRTAGRHLGEAQEAASSIAGAGCLYIEDGESGDLMAGAATVLTEVLEDEVHLDTVVVPIGGGNLIAGALLAREAASSEVELVGVQSVAAQGAARSWLTGELTETECATFAGGLATTRPGHLALEVMTRYLDTLVLVDEKDLYEAIGTGLFVAGIGLEGAAASPIAAMDRFGDSIEGDAVGLVLTGSWFSELELMKAVEASGKLSA